MALSKSGVFRNSALRVAECACWPKLLPRSPQALLQRQGWPQSLRARSCPCPRPLASSRLNTSCFTPSGWRRGAISKHQGYSSFQAAKISAGTLSSRPRSVTDPITSTISSPFAASAKPGATGGGLHEVPETSDSPTAATGSRQTSTIEYESTKSMPRVADMAELGKSRVVESSSMPGPPQGPEGGKERGGVSGLWVYLLGATLLTAGILAYWQGTRKRKPEKALLPQVVKDAVQTITKSAQSKEEGHYVQDAITNAQNYVAEKLPNVEDAKKLFSSDDPLFNMPEFHLPDLTGMIGTVFGEEMAAALETVAKSMRDSVTGMGPWGLAELTVGLYAIGRAHAKFNVQDLIGKTERVGRKQLEEWRKDLEMVDATYYMEEGKDDPAAWVQEELRKRGVWDKGHVVKAMIESELLKPAHFIAICDASKTIYVCVRGTSSASDMFTDLAGSCEGLKDDEFVHCGMHKAATWLLELERDNLINLLKEKKGYRLRLMGHSLGAGTAAIAALKLREDPGVPEKDRITALCIAPPAIMSRNLAERCSEFVTSLVLQDDIIPRASLGSLEDLRTEILLTDWAKMLDLDTEDPRLKAIETYVISSLKSMKPTVQEVEQWLKHAGSVKEALKQFGPQEKLEKIAGKPDTEVAGKTTAEQAAELLKVWGIEAEGGKTKATVEDEKSGEEEKKELEENARQALNLESQRLFAPGVLYHILRFKPAEQKTRESMGVKEGVIKEQSTKAREEEKEELSKEEMMEQAFYEVYKGKPGERFSRIVLSDTMFEDHFTEAYMLGLRKAFEAAK